MFPIAITDVLAKKVSVDGIYENCCPCADQGQPDDNREDSLLGKRKLDGEWGSRRTYSWRVMKMAPDA